MFACGSFDDDSVVTLVHVFVVSPVDYCLGLLAKTTDKLQRVLNAAARVVSNSVVRYPRYLDTYRRYLGDNTSIAKVTIYRGIS